MVLCPECETDLDIEEDEVDEGEIVSCPECGTDFEVITINPLELNPLEEEEDDDSNSSIQDDGSFFLLHQNPDTEYAFEADEHMETQIQPQANYNQQRSSFGLGQRYGENMLPFF